MINKIAAFSLVGLILTGCDTYTTPQYQTNPSNVIALQSIAASGKGTSVGTVTAAAGIVEKPTCRLAGPLDLGGGQNISKVVEQALQAEFLAGKMYNRNGRAINVVVTELKPDSFAGTWTIGMRVSSNKGQSYDVNTVHKFGTSFSAAAACKNTADAFNRALSKSINNMISDPRFKSLI